MPDAASEAGALTVDENDKSDAAFAAMRTEIARLKKEVADRDAREAERAKTEVSSRIKAAGGTDDDVDIALALPEDKRDKFLERFTSQSASTESGAALDPNAAAESKTAETAPVGESSAPAPAASSFTPGTGTSTGLQKVPVANMDPRSPNFVGEAKLRELAANPSLIDWGQYGEPDD